MLFQSGVQSISVEEDLSMSLEEGLILDKFKVIMEPHLTDEYMNDDIYLVRWLRATNFSMDAAEQKLLKALQWRKENRMDNIDNEDWSYFEEEYAYSLEIIDYQNRPILTIDSSKWNVRAAVLSGRRDQLIRWMTKMLENANKKVRSLQDEGKNVTRWGMIYNLGYFNLVQAGCIQCLSVYAKFVTNYESYYPNTMDSITLINTPSVFDFVLQLVRPLMSPETRKMLKVFGTNKKQWQEALLKEIPKNQLPTEYGGSKIRENLD